MIISLWRQVFAVTLLMATAKVGAQQPATDPWPLQTAQQRALASPESPKESDVRLVTVAVPLAYSVLINGRREGDALLLRLPDGSLLAREADFKRWRLRLPEGPAVLRLDGDEFYAIDRLPGFRYRADLTLQEAELDFAPQAFTATRIDNRQRGLLTAQKPPSLGGFFNYDFLGSRQESSRTNFNTFNGQFEAGLFNPWGVLTSQVSGQNLAGDRSLNGNRFERRVVRLDSTFTHDDPDSLRTLTLGDTTGGSALIGRPVRFGGIRLARNFSTQPGYLTLPQPAISGDAALPSVLDIYVNGVLNQRQDLPPGPFQIDSLPTVNGLGEVQVVVRDLLGREQLISQSYFTGAQQLRTGLHDYSYEAGFLRRRFGLRNADYGAAVAIGSHRYGFSNEFTGEARAEYQDGGPRGGGIGAIVSVLPLGVLSSAFALSDSRDGTGGIALLGLERTVRRSISFGARYQRATAAYRQVGSAPGFALPSHVFNTNASYRLPGIGSLGLSYSHNNSRTPDITTSVLTGSFTTSFRRVSLSLLASTRLEPNRNHSAFFRLGMPLGSRRDYASAGYRHNEAADGFISGRSFVNLQRNLPQGEGWGYTARLGESHNERVSSQVDALGSLSLNAPHGSYIAEAAHSRDVSAYRASISGGVGTLAGHSFASRRINSSFAIVDTGVEGLNLNVYNQRSATTGPDGFAVLPNIQPYQRNLVEIDATDLPLDIEIPIARVETAPYFRSGVVVALPARRSRGAVLMLTRRNGQPVPAGATVRLGDGEYPVGREGQAYVGGLQLGENTAEVRWPGARCSIRFELAAEAGFQPTIDNVVCQ